MTSSVIPRTAASQAALVCNEGLIFTADPEKRAPVCERLRKLIHVNVGFDNEGSKIVIYQPDTA
jgi:hypothetical protein